MTHTYGSKYADFKLDTNHDLRIKPLSTGQIKIQPTTDSTDFFQVLDAAGTAILNVDATNERVGIGTTSPQGALDVVSTTGGFIVPRMIDTQQGLISAFNGMIIYDTTNNQFEFYENGAWVTK